MFFNTINLFGDDLQAAKVQASCQEEVIKAIFKVNAGKEISPSQIMAVTNTYYGLNWPLTSIRRAITCLTKDSVLVKLSTMRKGIYGVLEHCWTFKIQKPVQVELF